MKTREGRLTNVFVELADTLVQDFDLTDVLYTLACTCVELLDAAAAGIVLAGPSGTLQVVGSSEERMLLLELFELQNDEGPCMDSYATGEQVTETDLRSSDRWPLFTQRALEEGFVSVDALPLRLRDTRLGALNVFRTVPGGLSVADRSVAQALADVAAIGLLQERAIRESQLLAEQLQRALNSRVMIEQAKGVLAAQGDIDVGQAFELLRANARLRSVAAREVAREVIAGEISVDDLR